MNVRLRKEVQMLFWPWLVCALVGFLPLVVWWFTGTVSSSASTSYELINWRHTSYFIANSTFAIGVAILVSLPFGSELQQRTLGLLLSQPFPRWQIWREKILVMLVAVLTLTLAHAAGYLINPAAIVPNLVFATTFLLVVACSGVFWSLACRSVLGGTVMSLLSLIALLLLVDALTDQYFYLHGITYRLSSAQPLALAGALGMAPLFLWLAWKMFSRIEPLAAGHDESGVAAANSPRGGLLWFRCRANRPTFNFILKELLLLKPVFWLMAAFAMLWALAALGATMVPRKTVMFTNLVNGFSCAYTPLAIILCGVLSLGEEKKLGIHTANLSLPLSPLRQWLMKNVIATVAGLTATVVLFSVMNHLTGAKLEVFPANIMAGSGTLTAWIGILVFCLVQISFSTAIIADRTSHAAFLAVILAAGSVAAFFGGWMLGHKFVLPVQNIVYWGVAHGQMTCWLAQKWATAAGLWMWCLSCLSAVYAGWVCFRHLHRESRKLIRLVTVMLSCILTLSLFLGSVSHSLGRENFMQSPLCQEVKAAFVALSRDVPPSGLDKKQTLKVAPHEVGHLVSPKTQAWLRDCTFEVVYEPNGLMRSAPPKIYVIVQFAKPGRYEIIYLKPRLAQAPANDATK